MNSDDRSFRDTVSSEERALPLNNVIDPGFVNHRLVETLLGERGMAVVDEWSSSIPQDLPSPLRQVRIDHIYTRTLLKWSELNKIPTLREALHDRLNRVVVTSTEELGPFPDIYEAAVGENLVKLDGFGDVLVTLRYSTDKIASSTLKSRLRTGFPASFVATMEWESQRAVVLRPVVMGSPWVESDNPEEMWAWHSWDFYEHFVEDIAEFSKVRDLSLPDSPEPMRYVSEAAFKASLGEILGDRVTADWGGEQNDHFSAHLHIGDRRVTAAFLLKGPARFSAMGLNHLGQNNDQIYRLAQSPAGLLVVQHAHDIQPAVRATLRAFAVQPGSPRRYCLMDGRDSLRLLQAYGLYDKAIALTEQERAVRDRRRRR